MTDTASPRQALMAIKEAPAFGHGDHTHGGAPGLTKREYFAALFMAPMVADDMRGFDHVAKIATDAADALCQALAALEKDQ